jgi:hypothetical protein
LTPNGLDDCEGQEGCNGMEGCGVRGHVPKVGGGLSSRRAISTPLFESLFRII